MSTELEVSNICATVRQLGATRWEGDDGLGGVGVLGGNGRLGSTVEGMDVLVLAKDRLEHAATPFWRSPDHFDRLCVAAHVVLERQCLGDEIDEFSPISARRLAEVVGRDFAGSALKFLCDPEVGLLVTNRRYTPGLKCRGYRFRDDILALDLSSHWIPPKLAVKIGASEARHSRIEVGDDPRHILLWQNLCRLTLSPHPADLYPKKSANPKIQLKRHLWRLSVGRIHLQRWHFSTGRQTGRVFNNFTSLPKLLRPYALLDGRPCAEIDIRNSQPFFLAELYPNQSAEARRFITTVCDGQFYETVNAASGNPFPCDARDKLKKAVYSGILFGKRYTESILWSGFVSRFPELSRIITVSKSKAHNLLAIDLQRREARLMIRHVVPRLDAALPGVAFLTVHDSLTIDDRYVDQAVALITECAIELTGNIPALRITPPAPACTPCVTAM